MSDLALTRRRCLLGDVVHDMDVDLTDVVPWGFAFLLLAQSKSGRRSTFVHVTLLWVYLVKLSDLDISSVSRASQRVWRLELNERSEQCLVLWHIEGTRVTSSQMHSSRRTSVGCEAPLEAMGASFDLASVSSQHGVAVVLLMSVIVSEAKASPRNHVPDHDYGICSVRSLCIPVEGLHPLSGQDPLKAWPISQYR